MDIALRHSFTLSGAWKMLFPNPPSTGEGGIRRKSGVEAGSEQGSEYCAANINLQADEPEEVDDPIDSDDDSTSSISDLAESHNYSQVLRLDSLLDQRRGPKTLQDFANDHMAQTERLLQTILIQNTDAERKEVWIELRGSVAANVINTVERARKAMAEFKESTDSWEVKDERLRRALGMKVDTAKKNTQDPQALAGGMATAKVELARKEKGVQAWRRKRYDGQDTMENVVCSQNALLTFPKEKYIETEEFIRSIEAKSAELHEIGLEIRDQEDFLPQKPFICGGNSSIEDESGTVQAMSVQTQDKQLSEDSKAKLFEEGRSEIRAEYSQKQIYELDARELDGEADNDDESLNDLPEPLAELSGQGRAAARAEAPVCVLQESGSSKQQQQREKLNAMWIVSSAYVEPIAGIPTNPHVQTLDPSFSRHKLQGGILILDDAAPGHQGPSLGTAVQKTISSQAMITQIAIADPTGLDAGTDSYPHPSDSSPKKSSPRAATEVATAALLEQLSTEQDDQEGSNVNTWNDIAKFDRGMSRFTLRTHIIFSIVYAIWIAVLYRFIATAIY